MMSGLALAIARGFGIVAVAAFFGIASYHEWSLQPAEDFLIPLILAACAGLFFALHRIASGRGLSEQR
jgi:hypothetical protein